MHAGLLRVRGGASSSGSRAGLWGSALARASGRPGCGVGTKLHSLGQERRWDGFQQPGSLLTTQPPLHPAPCVGV